MALQGNWSWRNIGISAISSAAGSAVGSGVQDQSWAQSANGLGQRLLAGLGGALTTRSLTSGAKGGYESIFASTLGNAIGESLSEPSYKTLQGTGPGVERMERIDIGKLPDLAPIDIDRNLPRLDLSAAGGGSSSDYGYAGDDGQVPAGLANKPGVRFKDGVYPGGWQRSDGYGLSTPVLWRDKPGGRSWEEIPLEQLPRVVVTGKSEATRAREAWAQQSEPVLSFREASEARVAQDMAEYQARIDSGPQMSAITPEMDAAARAEAAQKEGLQNFLKGQGEMSVGGPVSAAMYLATNDVVAASSAADAMAPIEGFWAPRGGANTTATRLASRVRPAGTFSKDAPYVIRYNPAFPGRPDPNYSIDSLSFKNPSDYNAQGFPRDAGEFWRSWAKMNPTSLSSSNKYLIDNYNRLKVSPRVDQTRVKALPEHADYMGDVLVHHHVDFGQYTIPVPGRTHVGSGGIWHF